MQKKKTGFLSESTPLQNGAGMTDRRTRMRRVDLSCTSLYFCLPDYGNTGLQRAKNVGSFFVMEGSKKFSILISQGWEKLNLGTENAFLFEARRGVIDSQSNKEDRMHKPILILFIVLGFIIFAGDIFGQGIYKSVDEKGTVNFSDNPNSPVVTTKKGSAKQDGTEVLKRNEKANKRTSTDSDIEAILLKRPTWRGSASSSGGSSVRGRS